MDNNVENTVETTVEETMEEVVEEVVVEKIPSDVLIKGGILPENPLLRLGLGICPAIAVTGYALNGLAMGAATACVLVLSSLVCALLGMVSSDKNRIAVSLIVTAAFTAVVQMLMKGWFPAWNEALGIFVPLIAVSSLLLNRATFAATHGVGMALADAIGMGVGYTCALTIIGIIREFFGHCTLFGLNILPAHCSPMVMVALPAGGFILVGVLMGIFNAILPKKIEKEEETPV